MNEGTNEVNANTTSSWWGVKPRAPFLQGIPGPGLFLASLSASPPAFCSRQRRRSRTPWIWQLLLENSCPS